MYHLGPAAMNPVADYAKKVGSSDYLQIDVTSSVYVCGSGGDTPVTQLYGSYYEGSMPDGCWIIDQPKR